MRAAAAAALVLGALAAPAAAPAAGDADRGARLHEACLQCHGTEAYVPPKRRVTTLKALQNETARWGDYYNPKFTKQEVQDLVAWLNREFYRFPQ